MTSTKETKVSRILQTNVNIQTAKVSDNKNENTFVCDKNDKDCWHRYLSAMGDCF